MIIYRKWDGAARDTWTCVGQQRRLWSPRPPSWSTDVGRASTEVALGSSRLGTRSRKQDVDNVAPKESDGDEILTTVL